MVQDAEDQPAAGRGSDGCRRDRLWPHGGALACALRAAGHELLLAGRPGSTSATRLAEILGRVSAVPVRVLIHEAEVVMLAVPFHAALELMTREAAQVDARRPLVDVTNPILD